MSELTQAESMRKWKVQESIFPVYIEQYFALCKIPFGIRKESYQGQVVQESGKNRKFSSLKSEKNPETAHFVNFL